jgi:hypothetical protein
MRIVEAAATLLVALMVGLLLLGYRDRRRVGLADELAAVLAMLAGASFAMLWELTEFVLDWVGGFDLQPTNTSSMLDLLASDVAAIVGAVFATWLYCHALRAEQQKRLGERAAWLTDGPSRVLDRHGFAITLGFTAVIVVSVALLWFAGRPVPGFPIG